MRALGSGHLAPPVSVFLKFLTNILPKDGNFFSNALETPISIDRITSTRQGCCLSANVKSNKQPLTDIDAFLEWSKCRVEYYIKEPEY